MGTGDIDEFFASIEKGFRKEDKPTPTAKENVLSSGLEGAKREIEAEFKQKKDKNSFPSAKDNIPTENLEGDDLFSDIERQFKEKSKQQYHPSDRKNVSAETQKDDDLFSDIEKQFKDKNKPKPQPSSQIDTQSLFADITRQFEQKRRTESNKNTLQDVEEIRRQEAEKRRKEKQLIQKAEEFLKNLDPYSDEGFWFEQFAQSYESRLQAAMEYLQAMEGGK
ncbi:MAG: hypothetical protein NZ901_12365 [Geminocystis sp.]|nr:hypothetical protein [Geminocystis sp.]MCS7148962.1 hypothetical protein [Geminocystis sp.]MDW8117191.1 hypothetical protein [Geminocystis sp.]HIK37066.1 hypothetical protein [Geminocystis sp. M7585_C2015_104]